MCGVDTIERSKASQAQSKKAKLIKLENRKTKTLKMALSLKIHLLMFLISLLNL